MGIRMSRFVLLVVDVALMVLATLAAFILSENFRVSERRFLEFLPYFAATGMAALAVFPAAGLNRTVWRNFALPGYWRVLSAVAATVCAAAAMGFAYNRLDGLPPSLPILQFLAGLAILSGGRALHRFGHMAREDRKTSAIPPELASTPPALTVIVVGISGLAETYLQAATELAPGRIKDRGPGWPLRPPRGTAGGELSGSGRSRGYRAHPGCAGPPRRSCRPHRGGGAV